MKTKFIPTKKIKEILDNRDTYCTHIGTDFGGYVEELQDILWHRENRSSVASLRRELEALEAYEDYLDSEGVPPWPYNSNFKPTNHNL